MSGLSSPTVVFQVCGAFSRNFPQLSEWGQAPVGAANIGWRGFAKCAPTPSDSRRVKVVSEPTAPIRSKLNTGRGAPNRSAEQVVAKWLLSGIAAENGAKPPSASRSNLTYRHGQSVIARFEANAHFAVSAIDWSAIKYRLADAATFAPAVCASDRDAA